jgi:3-isopropylmalate dehydrogenase
MSTNQFRICVLPGDGIGNEIMQPCMRILDTACSRIGGISLAGEDAPAGAACYQAEGTALPAATLDLARNSDAIILGAMGDPSIRYPDGTEIAPQIDLRMELDLYAGVRPARSVKGVAGPLADPRGQQLDFVLIRESTEGLFSSFGKGKVYNDRAEDTQVITRKGSERLFRFAFKLAEQRKAAGGEGVVTCVDKANIFKSFAYFREIFDEISNEFTNLQARRAYVDATALEMVRKPWVFDVMVTENMFGDILSDLAAGLIGGMGMAPSADIGDEHAVFQPCHGSAPDIAGKGLANPAAMVLSGAMMLDWLGHRHSEKSAIRAGRLVQAAVDEAFASGLKSVEFGGNDGTVSIVSAIESALDKIDPETI